MSSYTQSVQSLINELALWWVEERPLPKEEMVRQATRMVRAVCDSEG